MLLRLGAIYVLTVLVLSLTGVVGWQRHIIGELSSDIDAADKDNKSLRHDLATVRERILADKVGGDATRAELESFKSKNATAERELGVLQKEFSELSERAAAAEAEKADIRQRLEDEILARAASEKALKSALAERAAPPMTGSIEPAEPKSEPPKASTDKGDKEAKAGVAQEPAQPTTVTGVPPAAPASPDAAASPAQPGDAQTAEPPKKPAKNAAKKRKKAPAQSESYFSF